MPPKLLCRCQFCNKRFVTQKAVNQHISASKICHNEWRRNLVRDQSPSPKRSRKNSPNDDLEFNYLLEEINPPPSPPNLKGRQATVEDEDAEVLLSAIQTNNMNRFIEAYLGPAGEALQKGKTRFETWLEKQETERRNPWEPFASKEEWELAGWLMKNVGQKSTDEYLKLQIVSKP
jgi:hypothetical protein